jgi:Na+-driven multidrug efflux pump
VTSPAPLWKNFLFFFMPMMASNILQSLFGTIEGIWAAYPIAFTMFPLQMSYYLLV